jgi:hypothetical protein
LEGFFSDVRGDAVTSLLLTVILTVNCKHAQKAVKEERGMPKQQFVHIKEKRE